MKKVILITCFVLLICGNTLAQDFISSSNERPRLQSKEVLDSINRSNFLKNNSIANKFFTSPKGGCFLSYVTSNFNIFKKSEITNDEWEKAYDGIYEITFDPNNLNVVYSIMDDKVMKSMDSGENWREIQNGLPLELEKSHLIVNPSNSSEVFLITSIGVFKTTDEGFSWSLFFKCSNATRMQIVDNNKFYLLTNFEIFSTNDAGNNWSNISKQLPTQLIKGEGRIANYSPIKVLEMFPINLNTSSCILASTEKGLFKSNDDGKTWSLVLNDPIMTMYIHDNCVYVGGEDQPILYQSKDCIEWKKININASYIKLIWGIYKDDVNAGLFIFDGDKIAYIDTTFNVIGLNYGFIKNSTVLAEVKTVSNNKDIIFRIIKNNDEIDVADYGVWQSNNNGLTWTPTIMYTTPDYYNNSLTNLYVSPYNSNELLLFNKGFNMISFDGGNQWGSLEDNKIKIENDFNIMDFHFDPINSNVLYFITSYYNGSNMLIRYDRTTMGSTELRKIEINERRPLFIVAKDNNKKIFINSCDISIDGGWTWNSIFEKVDEIATKNDFNINTSNIIPIEYVGNKIDIEINEIRTYTSRPRKYARIVSDDNGETWTVNKIWEDKKNEND